MTFCDLILFLVGEGFVGDYYICYPSLCYPFNTKTDDLLNDKMTGEISTPPVLIRLLCMVPFIINSIAR